MNECMCTYATTKLNAFMGKGGTNFHKITSTPFPQYQEDKLYLIFTFSEVIIKNTSDRPVLEIQAQFFFICTISAFCTAFPFIF